MTALGAGVWIVVPTPFESGSLAVDLPSLRGMIRAYVDLAEKKAASSKGGKVAGLVALAVFGEAARLSVDERQRVLAAVLKCAGSLKVVVGVPFTKPDEVADEVELIGATSMGRVAALMVQVNSNDPGELRIHLKNVNKQSGLPIVVQDYPPSSGVTIQAEALAQALKGLPFIAAVKCESPPTSVAIAQLHSLLPEIPLFGGLGGVGLLDELAAGAAGAMTGFSYPEALVDIVAAFETSGFDAARQEISPWLPLMNFEGQVSIGLAIRKTNIKSRGLIAHAVVRPPGRQLPVEIVPLVRHHQLSISNALKRAALGSSTAETSR